MNHILGPNGTPMVELGGARAWRQFTKGDIIATLQWLELGMQGQGEGPEPVLALFPAHRRIEAGAYVVSQANAYQFANRDGTPTPHLVGAAYKAALVMGFHPDKSTMFRIIDAICECMPDLISMPSEQPGALHIERAVAGIEATMSVNGKTVAEAVF